jgi:hypothetical protein
VRQTANKKNYVNNRCSPLESAKLQTSGQKLTTQTCRWQSSWIQKHTELHYISLVWCLPNYMNLQSETLWQCTPNKLITSINFMQYKTANTWDQHFIPDTKRQNTYTECQETYVWLSWCLVYIMCLFHIRNQTASFKQVSFHAVKDSFLQTNFFGMCTT